MTRTPFRVTIYDAHTKAHCVTVWLEIPDPPGLFGWEAICAVEASAAEDVCANLECSIDVDAMMAGEFPVGQP